MTSGTISSIEYRLKVICLRVTDEKGKSRGVRISPTNYALRPGDFLSWDRSSAWWTSQHGMREIRLLRPGGPLTVS